MDFIFQRTGAPDDTILIRRKGRASYTIKIANHTEDYFGEGSLHEYELKDYIELLYLSLLEDAQHYEYLQKLAQQRGVSINDIIVEALEEYHPRLHGP